MDDEYPGEIGGDIMRIIKYFFCTTIVFILIFSYCSAIVFAEPRALPTTHYMASNMRLLAADSSATESTLPNISGPVGIPLLFRTFDQVSCNIGQYEIVLSIVKPEDNTVIATTKPVSFTAPTNGYVYTQPAVWQVLFPSVGWYRYDVIINGQPIVYYYFVVSFII